VYETRQPGSPWSYDANLGLVVGDSRINRYFYEVAPQYATPTRPAYQADAGLMLVRLGLSTSYKFNDDVRLFGFVRLESYSGAANRDSPLMKKDNDASAGIGFSWTLGRSKTAARGAP
jgi:outer membrane scaffolding protein for murein synthesis (MipA/OmpV family)